MGKDAAEEVEGSAEVAEVGSTRRSTQREDVEEEEEVTPWQVAID